MKEVDTHGGPHGDGEYFAEIQLSDEGYAKFLQDANKSGKWESLPMTSELNALIVGGEYDNVTFEGAASKYINNEIINGIFYFRDRYKEHYPEDKEELINRSSFNFTVAFLDFDTKIIYL